MRLSGYVVRQYSNKYHLTCCLADSRRLYRHIWFADATETLKRPGEASFDADGNTVEAAPNALVLPIRDTAVTVHCKKKLTLNKTYTFDITYRWYTNGTTHVCVIMASPQG